MTAEERVVMQRQYLHWLMCYVGNKSEFLIDISTCVKHDIPLPDEDFDRLESIYKQAVNAEQNVVTPEQVTKKRSD